MLSQAPSINGVLRSIDRFTAITGRSVAWLIVLMVAVECLVVVLRYGFDFGSIAMQESVNYLHACCFMLGAAYTLQHDEHVRVDIFYRNFSPRRKALVNLGGFLVFLLPVCLFIFWESLPYVGQAWSTKEASSDAGGLKFVYLLKTLIPVFAVTLILQGLAEALRSIQVINGNADKAADAK